MRQSLQQLGVSAFFAVIAFLLIVGGLATTLAEKNVNTPSLEILTETSLPTSVPQTDVDIETPLVSGLVSPTGISASPTSPVIFTSPTATLSPSTACPAPSGWNSYIVQLGDNLTALAQRYGVAASTLKEANCLVADELLPETRLHVPPYPTATPIPCGAPRNWTMSYYVKSGDNLYQIGLKYRVSVQELQLANCLGYSTQIKVGQRLFVPNVPTSTPAVTNTPPATPTSSHTPTLNPSMTASPTNTSPSATETATFTPVPPTATVEETATQETVPSATATSDS